MKSGEQRRDKRIANKLELLRTIRNAGIWLVDASISALYHARSRLAAGNTYDGRLRD